MWFKTTMVIVMREVLLSECIDLLYESHFVISKPFGRSCFDLIAKKGNLRLLIKILKNIDSLSTEQSDELLNISKMLQAVPVIIGTRTRNSIMEEGAVYERYGIKAVTFNTFRDQLSGEPPVVYANRGGFFVNIDGKVLRETREKLKISVGELAEVSLVSRKTIYKYEQNEANPSAEVAIKIEEYLDVPLIKGINIMDCIDGLKSQKSRDDAFEKILKEGEDFKIRVIDILGDMGFNLLETTKAPFDAVAEESKGEDAENQNIIFTNIQETENEEIRRKAMIVDEISKILNSHSLLVLEKKTNENKRITSMSISELEKIGDTVDLLDFIEKRKKSKEI